MKLRVATLCDAATTREGLLNVLSAGITYIARPQFPAPMGISLGVLFEAERSEVGSAHTMSVVVRAPGGLDTLAQIDAELVLDQPTDEVETDMPLYLPVGFSLLGVLVPSPGRYDVTITLDENVIDVLPFTAKRVPAHGTT